MVDPVKRYALIINGDTEERHKQNVERALAVFGGDDYETYVASVARPRTQCDHYDSASLYGLKELVADLKTKIDSNDELVIYTTGHGAVRGGDGGICLTEGCYVEPVDTLLDEVVYGKRTVIMDQCYSGNWAKLFLDDPKTLFISAGANGEETCCSEFAPYFWKNYVSDQDDDGDSDWEDRFKYALSAGKSIASQPQCVKSTEERQGSSSVDSKILEVSSKAELNEILDNMKGGQYAFVFFTMNGCGHCKKYMPVFEGYSKKFKDHIFIKTKGMGLAMQMGISSFPTVMRFSGRESGVEIDRYVDVEKTPRVPAVVAVDYSVKNRKENNGPVGVVSATALILGDSNDRKQASKRFMRKMSSWDYSEIKRNIAVVRGMILRVKEGKSQEVLFVYKELIKKLTKSDRKIEALLLQKFIKEKNFSDYDVMKSAYFAAARN
ncbi:hypothetical protein KKA47_04250 [bacterium]|nr:hypothetical protein [bacterium]